ncbi:hypothetical protein [Wolbachia pipientis]|nr:hypothetical protein [Wolbachia pipientis]MDM8335389.1 hypothetical protein [Wolbachia pipientis]
MATLAQLHEHYDFENSETELKLLDKRYQPPYYDTGGTQLSSICAG